MKLDDGLFVLIFAGFGLCGLYFWSALRELRYRITRLVQIKRDAGITRRKVSE